MTGYRQVLRVPSYRDFVLNQVLTNAGDGLLATGAVYAAATLGVSAWGLGLVGGALTIPKAVVGPFGGVLSDRTDIKYFLVCGEALRVLAVGLLFACFASGLGSLWLLVVLTGLASAVPGLTLPAAKSLIPKLVPTSDLQAANGLAQAVMWPAFFVGSGLLAVVVLDGSSSLPFLVIAVLLTLAVLALLRIPRQPRPAVGQLSEQRSLRYDVAAGYRELRGQQALHRRIVTYGLFTFLWRGTLQVLIPLVVLQHAAAPPWVYGALMFVNGAAEFVSALVIGRLTLRRPLASTFACEVLLAGALLGILASLGLRFPEIALFPSVVMIGMAAATIEIPLITLVQQQIGQDNVGKVFSYWVTIGSGGGAAGSLLFGLYFDVVPLGLGTLAVAVLALSISIALVTSSRRAAAAPT